MWNIAVCCVISSSAHVIHTSHLQYAQYALHSQHEHHRRRCFIANWMKRKMNNALVRVLLFRCLATFFYYSHDLKIKKRRALFSTTKIFNDANDDDDDHEEEDEWRK